MRIIVLLNLILIIITAISANAQTRYYSGMDPVQRISFNQYHQLGDSSNTNKKWFLSKYGGISASYLFFNGGGASVLSAPLGLQLNRRLTNNLYAFGGISVAPAYINFNNAGPNKNYPAGNFSMYSRAEMGLMYINDQKTFSISGSIGVERNSYPVYPYNTNNRGHQEPVIHHR